MNDQAGAPNADPERAFDGHYQLGSEIGAGARGVVYRGVDEKLDRAVAIKVWHARFEEGAAQREQYDAEARALTALDHPNLVAISDYGIAGKAPYLVMELLEGERLDARMRAGMVTSVLAQGYMQSVLRALGYMHMRGIVHRNLKPGNIFLQRGEAGETLKLLDLGLESLVANDNAAAGGAALLMASAYDAPELDQGIEADGRADVYAAGVLMLHMLSGHEPARDALRAASQAHGAALLEWLTGLMPNAIAEVKVFIAKAIGHERSSRFGNADQMLRALLELPTPWLTGQEEEPAPLPLLASARPISRPTFSSLAASDTQAVPAAEGGAEPALEEPAAQRSETELKPVGLIARLRARKKLLLIAGGVVALSAGGAAFATFLSRHAATTKPVEEPAKVAAKPEEKPIAAQAGAPALEHPYHAEEVEEIDEGEEAVAKGAAGATAPAALTEPPAQGSEQVHAETPPPAPKAPGPAAAVLPARQAAPSGAAATAAPEPIVRGPSKAEAVPPPSARNPSDAQHDLQPMAAAPVDGKAVAPEETAQPAAAAAQADTEASPHEQTPQPTAAGPQAEPNAKGPAEATAAAPSAATNANANANAKAVETPPPSAAEEPKPEAPQAPPPKKLPTPQELGSERHIEPDQAEIRQMLALALKSSPRVAAANPWNMGEGVVPDSLQALRDAIAHGERGSASNIKALRRYNAANQDDVFGHLLLAGFYANRGYSLDALDQYDLAYRIDSSSRGAPEMLQHALSMVAQGIAQSDAERFIERVYGREALASITSQLRAGSTSSASATRLRQLQTRLVGKRR